MGSKVIVNQGLINQSLYLLTIINRGKGRITVLIESIEKMGIFLEVMNRIITKKF